MTETKTLPILPLRDIVVFPHQPVPLFVGREKSVRALEEAMKTEGKQILLATQKDKDDDDPVADGIYGVGVVATVLQLLKLPDGTVKVLVEGKASAKELQKANVSSWEHGLIRETDAGTAALKGNYLVARGEADAPDIDGRIYIRGNLPIGEFAKVRIIGHTDYDLIAEKC